MTRAQIVRLYPTTTFAEDAYLCVLGCTDDGHVDPLTGFCVMADGNGLRALCPFGLRYDPELAACVQGEPVPLPQPAPPPDAVPSPSSSAGPIALLLVSLGVLGIGLHLSTKGSR